MRTSGRTRKAPDYFDPTAWATVKTGPAPTIAKAKKAPAQAPAAAAAPKAKPKGKAPAAAAPASPPKAFSGGKHCTLQADGQRVCFDHTSWPSQHEPGTAMIGERLGVRPCSVAMRLKPGERSYGATIGVVPKTKVDLDTCLGDQPGAVCVRSDGRLIVSGEEVREDLPTWDMDGARLLIEWDGHEVLRVSHFGKLVWDDRNVRYAGCRFAVGGSHGTVWQLDASESSQTMEEQEEENRRRFEEVQKLLFPWK